MGYGDLLEKDNVETAAKIEQDKINERKSKVSSDIMGAANNQNWEAVNYMLRKYGPGGDDRTTIFNADEFLDLQQKVWDLQQDFQAKEKMVREQQVQQAPTGTEMAPSETAPTPGMLEQLKGALQAMPGGIGRLLGGQ